jgi:glycosyltransferase involved in cell wall biosynthesis
MIVQCHDDYRNLQKRHFFLRKKIARSTYIQTNNINPSWVACEGELELPPAGDAMVRVAYIASFDDKRKGSDILFPAVVRLMKEEYGVVLYVAGEGRNLAELKRNYGSCGNIIFLGQIADSGALLRQVDFSVVPSHRDSCPNTVLESLYAGTTVYGSNVGGIKEILKGEFLFEDSEEGVYHFLKNKLDQEAWKADKIKQQDLCCGLRFNWGEKIEAYMKEA